MLADCEACRSSRSPIELPLTVIGDGRLTVADWVPRLSAYVLSYRLPLAMVTQVNEESTYVRAADV